MMSQAETNQRLIVSFNVLIRKWREFFHVAHSKNVYSLKRLSFVFRWIEHVSFIWPIEDLLRWQKIKNFI